MDSLTHGLLSTLPIRVFNDKVGAFKATCICVLLVTIPDLDYLYIYLMNGHENYYFYHRGLSHSLIGVACLFAIYTFVLFKLDFAKLSKAMLISLITLSVAIIPDYLQTFGVMLEYPFSLERYYYALFFIIDPIQWLLGLSVLICVWFTKEQDLKRYLFCIGIVFCMYIASLIFLKEKAENLVKREIGESSVIESFPNLHGYYQWIVLVREHTGQVSQYKYHPYTGQLSLQGSFLLDYLALEKSLTSQQQKNNLTNFREFSSGWMYAKDDVIVDGQSGLALYDLKYFLLKNETLPRFGGYFFPSNGQESYFFNSSNYNNWLKNIRKK